MVRLTNEHIEEAASASGGWTKRQLAAIGVPWPPPKGWRKQAIGREITDETLNQFLARPFPVRKKKSVETETHTLLIDREKVVVYFLRRKDTKRVLYVGITSRPEQRLYEHLEGKTPHTAQILEWVRRSGGEIEMHIVRECDTRAEALAYEADLIERARAKGYRLANHILILSEKFRRLQRPWTDGERQRARCMFEQEHRSLSQIAKVLNRTHRAVKWELHRLGVEVPD